ncbi:MAG TPA: hypothetical protein VFS43_08705 [Polyangiaceae bacterium]|nr:hypothetical protein [Polyangiaceae bacterium]
MSFSFDPATYPLRLRVEGLFSSADLVDLDRSLAAHAAEKRPALLLDARAVSAPVILWTKARRTTLESLLRHVGPLAIVATDSAMLNAIRLALHPFGSDIVWRNFASIDEASTWLETIERHGRPIWNPAAITAPVSDAAWDRLWTAVRAKRWQSALQP